MGARKKISAEKRKEALKTMYFAKLQNVPTSPRKMQCYPLSDRFSRQWPR